MRYSCFISFSKRLGRPGYMLDPPERTMCLYSSERTSTAAAWIVENSISAEGGLAMASREQTRPHTCYAGLLDVDEVWLEHALRRRKSFLSNFNSPPIWQL